MIWKGKLIEDRFDIMAAAIKAIDDNEASLFKQTFADSYEDTAEGAQQWSALGYLAGYYDEPTYTKVLSVYDLEHPIFGVLYPTAEQAFALGQKWAADKGNEPVAETTEP